MQLRMKYKIRECIYILNKTAWRVTGHGHTTKLEGGKCHQNNVVTIETPVQKLLNDIYYLSDE